MKICRRLEDFPPGDRPVVLAAGSFDGLHLGHQRVIQTAIRHAARLGGEAWVLTFTPHPAQVIRPDRAPPLLTSDDEKRRAIGAAEPDGLLELPFTEDLARHPPREFIARLIRAIPDLRAFVVGPDWRFGQGASGSVDLLVRIGEAHGFDVVVAPAVHWQGRPVSSTRIRQAIAAGDFPAVEQMLGRPYALSGTVVAGRQLGRGLGFPTANIVPPQGALPPAGVFAVTVDVENRSFPGAAYYGHRSAHPEHPDTFFFEVFLFDFDGDLYGRTITVHLHAFLRPDRRFASDDGLRRQIRADAEAARRILSARRPAAGDGPGPACPAPDLPPSLTRQKDAT